MSKTLLWMGLHSIIAPMAALAKLMTLLAVLLMPFGMTAAASAAAPHHQPSVSMPMQHCPDQPKKNDRAAGFAVCTMACAAALPALQSPAAARIVVLCAPDAPAVAQRLHGVQPETATPPPKRS